jgi:inactivated superfamily I helicase
LRTFLTQAAATRRPLHLNFAAHSSLALAAGYFLEAKSGLDITIRQRGRAGIQEWRALIEERPEGPLIQHENDHQEDTQDHQDHQDVALALSVTRSIQTDVQHYLSNAGINARILPATIAGGPSSTSLWSGIHALRFAEVLACKLEKRTAREKTGLLHLFAAAPNALLFFLGQLLHGSGRIQLYEHDFYSNLPGSYQPSILLPPQ